jgi:hypothetical protein
MPTTQQTESAPYMNDASAPAGALKTTDANTKPSAANSIHTQNSPRKIARK